MKKKNKETELSYEDSYTVNPKLIELIKRHPKTLYQDIAQLYKSGEIVWDDIRFAHNQSLGLNLTDMIEISGEITQSKTAGLTNNQARDLAQRFHFMLLSNLLLVNDPSYSQKEQTFRQYEKMFDDLKEGNVPDDQVKFLQSLNPIEDWDHQKSQEMFLTSPFNK